MSYKKVIGIICIALLSVVMFGLVSYGEEKRTNRKDATTLTMEGDKLSSEEVEKLESELKANPDNLSIRTKLLGYYFLKAHDLNSARKARQKHVIWVIENAPDAEIAGLPYTTFHPVFDKGIYYEAKKLWLKQVETHKKNTAILGNAANFFLIYDSDIAEDFLKRAQAIEPDNPEWSERLGYLYGLEVSGKSGEPRREAAVKSLNQLEKALSNTTEEIDRFYMLDSLAEAAFEAGVFEKAEAYATELLNKASRYKNNWNYGNAIHFGNLILGRIALKTGNVEESKVFLLKAGATPGSPQLNSFGPNMTLAKELLEKGEKETVIEYLKLCGKFWEKDILNDWMQTIEAGDMPDFGLNLNY